MSNKTRKLIWSVPVLAVFAVAAALAAFVALGTEGDGPQTALAQDDASATSTIESSSTSASATVQLTLTIPKLTARMLGGSSVELYLEDDFKVPATFPANSAFFTASGATAASVTADPDRATAAEVDTSTSSGGRVYVTDPVEKDTDAHFTAQKSDHAIRFLIPDMNTDDNHDGFDGPEVDQNLTLVILKSAGIKNPSEAGTHSVGFAILGPTDGANDGPEYATTAENARQTSNTIVTLPAIDAVKRSAIGLKTLAKISLSDQDATRGYELTVTGSGFNNGTTADVYVKHYATEPAATDTENVCQQVIREGTKVGSGIVGTDDKVSVTFTVAGPPIFGTGSGTGDNAAEGNNYICMVDGEGRRSDTDVERFELEPSIRIVPTTVSAGDNVRVFAEDFPAGLAFTSLKLAGTTILTTGPQISSTGSATVQFTMPGNYSGTIRVDADWGGTTDDAKITAGGSELTLSKTEVLPLESITIRGNDFSTAACSDNNHIRSLTIDSAVMELEDGDPITSIEKSSAGQFVFTAIVAEENQVTPITPGTHTIEVIDCNGYTGSATFTVKEPTITVSPDVAGPRETVVISGSNWPVDNDKSDINVRDVDVTINFGSDTDSEDAEPDVNGNFRITYRVDKDVTIPSTVSVEADYNSGDIIKIGSFSVPSATLKVEPASASPGDKIKLSASGLAPFESEIEIKVGGTMVSVPTGTFVDRDGDLSLEAVVPGLDPGLYTVQVDVGSEPSTVTIGELSILTDVQIGLASALPGALDDLGDNLVRVFYFNNVDKSWSFYDPRDEFAELNTLTELIAGQSYWILVNEDQKPTLNNKVRDFTCVGGECWNSIVW